jgi:enamine deaminase RidA (YjgF/YER057c/UK114 family)
VVVENIGAELKKAGSGFDRVVKCTVFLADMAEWAAMNEVYAPFFPEGKRPARTAVAVSGLAIGARVEIQCIAAA